jgi:dihydropteroate synthase
LLCALGRPIVAGLSRKGFVREMAGGAAAPDAASLAAGLAALSHGATILRVHDVAATVQAVAVWQTLSA